jgi:hypothetical protein
METGPWPWPERPRVLVEDPDLDQGLATAWTLRQAGYTVAICRGPEPDEYCPLVGADDCALVIGADVIVCGIGPEIEEAVRKRHPDKPVVAPERAGDIVAAVEQALAHRE